MSESGVQTFERSRTMALVYATIGVLWGANAFLQLLWFGPTGVFALQLITTGMWFAGAFIFMKPIARVTSDDISLGLAPIRAMRVIPWSTVQGASRSRSNFLVLALSDGKSVKVPLNQVKRAQRESLLAEIESRVGPVTQSG